MDVFDMLGPCEDMDWSAVMALFELAVRIDMKGK
jgi:hypothetical protein